MLPDFNTEEVEAELAEALRPRYYESVFRAETPWWRPMLSHQRLGEPWSFRLPPRIDFAAAVNIGGRFAAVPCTWPAGLCPELVFVNELLVIPMDPTPEELNQALTEPFWPGTPEWPRRWLEHAEEQDRIRSRRFDREYMLRRVEAEDLGEARRREAFEEVERNRDADRNRRPDADLECGPPLPIEIEEDPEGE